MLLVLVAVLLAQSVHTRPSDLILLRGTWTSEDFKPGVREYYFFLPNGEMDYNVHWKSKNGVMQRLTQTGNYRFSKGVLVVNQETMTRYVGKTRRYVGSGSEPFFYVPEWENDSTLVLSRPGFGQMRLVRVAPEAVKLDE